MKIYCLKCKKKQEIDNLEIVEERKSTKKRVHGQCHLCHCSCSQYIGSSVDIHKIIGKLPKPKGGFTLPGHKYTGPYNPLEKQLDQNDQPIRGQEPYNEVDRISLFHDICYRDNDNKEGKKECDSKMLKSLRELRAKGAREKFDKFLVHSIIGAKHKLGLGLKTDPKTDLESKKKH